MEKINVPPSSSRRLLHPSMAVLVTSGQEKGKPNIITLAWAMPASIDPPLVAISVGKSRYSHDLIRSSGEFVINVPSEDLLEEVRFCGSKSGSKVDKFEASGLTPEDSEEVDVPRIEECVGHLECKLINELTAGDHTVFIGKVLYGSVDENLFDQESEKFDLRQFRPIFHVGGPDFVTSGEYLG